MARLAGSCGKIPFGLAELLEACGAEQSEATSGNDPTQRQQYTEWFRDVTEWATAEEIRMKHARIDDKLTDDLRAWAAMLRSLRNLLRINPGTIN
ncbi:hypothetical protein NDU88_004612 [Pleurodeles waltl]|uniref:Uncharacterized protein n=1 Tax=Pleurodeles waltl TaxID=8319 RepID=A0AAV7LPT3_PLEWA|nr:hypothetical protein NDU88_004612 [Pleurodeles waltl]